MIEGTPYAAVLYQENGSLRVVDTAGNSLGGLEETGVYAAGYWNIELERGESTVWIDNLKFHYTQISQALPEREQREVSYRNWVATTIWDEPQRWKSHQRSEGAEIRGNFLFSLRHGRRDPCSG